MSKLKSLQDELRNISKEIDEKKPEFFDMGGHKAMEELRRLKATVKRVTSLTADAVEDLSNQKAADKLPETDLIETKSG